jgi:GNAT superfamily N-acetyltransferase
VNGENALTGTLSLVFQPVTPSNWSDMQRLFETKGGPKHCWCMVWRRSSEEARNQEGGFRKLLMQARVEAGQPVGILAYADDVPVAWCSIGPRGSHRPTMAPVLKTDAHENVWSLACFYVQQKFRHQGVMRQLIGAAGRQARQHGATILEAYPVEKDAPSYRFGGFVEVFEAAGFSRIGEAGVRRTVFRLRLNPASSAVPPAAGC